MAASLPLRAAVWPRADLVARLGARVDLLLIGGLVGLALAVRWPYLLLSPQFPSIGVTVLLALEVAEGRAAPLADQAPYLGALFGYLLAAAYKLFGPSVQITLLVPWLIGGLTVVPTYLLGRELGGRFAGVAAAGLLVTSGAHTVVSSHVPLSHSLTPLFAAATLWLLARAARRGTGRDLALAGLGIGLSLQTHPTVAPLLLGATAVVLARRRDWLRTRWPYLAAALALLGYSTLLLHHVQSRFEVVGDIQQKQARYLDADADAGEDAEHGVYVNNLEQLLLSAARLASGAIEERESAADFLRDPWVLAYSLLAVVGLAVAARRGNPLLLVALAPALLLPPLLSGKYKPILDGRYLMPLVPVLFVGIGIALASALDRLSRFRLSWLSAPASAAVVIVGLALVLHPLDALADFYEESQEDGFSNALYLQTLQQVRASYDGVRPVLLDPRLRDIKSAGGGTAGTNLTWLLAVSRVPTAPLDPAQSGEGLDGRLTILHRSTADRLDDQLMLTPLDGRRTNGRNQPSYRAYRVGETHASVDAPSAGLLR